MSADETTIMDDAHWPEPLDDMRGGFATRLNVYRMMAHRPDLLRAWAPLRDHVVVQTALGAELSEVAILRTGHHLRCAYEWDSHVYRARKLGMTDARIASIRGPLDAMDASDAVIAGAVDALFGKARGLSRAQVAEVEALVGRDGLFDLIATTGFYMTLGGILNTFDVPLDSEIAASLRDNPLT